MTLAQAAVAQAPAHHDALRVLPSLGAQEAAGDGSELLCELLDGAEYYARRLRIAPEQCLVETLLADLVARLVA
jgi:hypothetical protein